MKITNDVFYVGVNDHKVDLFEGQYKVPNGMSYNSYVIMDEKIAVMDTVDARFANEWLDNVTDCLKGRKPTYLVIQHMEMDHASHIQTFLKAYPDTIVVSTPKAHAMMEQFFDWKTPVPIQYAENGGSLCLGKHTLHFVYAPMVHWPEVMVTYDDADKILFSADGFGKFGALDVEEPWDDEARRYYIGIVGKYGMQVQALLKKAASLDIAIICPLHGPVLTEDLGHYLSKYDTWSSYAVETEGILLAYTSVYGNTKKAVEILADKFRTRGCPKVEVLDLARTDLAYAVSEAFRFGKLVLATTTYNAEIFPFMRAFIEHLTERGYKNRTVALVENGSWAPLAAKIMRDMLAPCKNLNILEPVVRIKSAVKPENLEEMDRIADELCSDYIAMGEEANKQDMTALFKLGYGLYVVTCQDGQKDNGLIVNTVSQVAENPTRVAVTVNKVNYSHYIISKTGILNVNCLSEDAPFRVFEAFGFRSGRTADKFADCTPERAGNGLIVLPHYINAFLSLKVEQAVDLGSHTMFVCSVTEARVLNDRESMTYAYYHANVKPKPQTEGKKGYVCKICGYVYEGEELPEDFVCPLCKHGPADFEPIV